MPTEFSEFSQLMPESPATGVDSYMAFDIKRLLFVQSPLMIAVALVLAIPTMLAAWFLIPLEYEASAILQFLAVAPRVMDSSSITHSASYTQYVNTQMALIKNDTVLMTVLDSPEVASLSVLSEASEPIEYLKKRVEVKILGRNSELVRISFRSTHQAEAKTILAQIVYSYQKYTASIAAEAGGKRMETLLKARDSQQSEHERQLLVRADLARRLKAPSLLDTLGLDVQHESLIRSEENLAEALSAITETEELLTQMEELERRYDKNPGEKILDFSVENHVRSDSQVLTLKGQLLTSETELNRLAAERVGDSSAVVAAKDKCALLSARLKKTEEQVRGETLRMLLLQHKKDLKSYKRNVENARESMETRRKFIEELQTEHELRAAKVAASQAELNELDVRLAEIGNSLSGVRKLIDTIHLESNAPARVRLASPASVPNAPDTGRRFSLLALAFLFSTGIGVGIGVLRELLDRRLHSPKEVRTITHVPLIAAIPHADEDPLLKSASPHLVTAQFPCSSTAHEYRRILAQIVYPPESSIEANSILVVSPGRGDGKTSVACNLAIMLAFASRHVLLVDTCGYAARIEEHFDLEHASGISEILHDGVDPLSLTRPTKIQGLDILGPGLHPEDVANKLVSQDTFKMFESLEHEYTHIIIDTVPGLLMSDAKLLAPLVDGVLVVVGAEGSLRGMVRRFMDELIQVNAPIIGTVMNKVRSTRGGYMKRNLKMYYGYSERIQLSAPDGTHHALIEGKVAEVEEPETLGDSEEQETSRVSVETNATASETDIETGVDMDADVVCNENNGLVHKEHEDKPEINVTDSASKPTHEMGADQAYVLLACPKCETELKVPVQYVGFVGKCQICGESVHVPETLRTEAE
ncbi:GumC family protein [Candidatus Hydrogenedentota bacterium]